MKPLRPKQEAFVRAYLETGNASEAYRRCYNIGPDTKPSTIARKAVEVLYNGNVAARLAELTEKAANLVVLDKAWVLDRLMRNARIAMGEETIARMVTKKNKETGEVTAVEIQVTDRDAAGANRALELLGKELGLFVERSAVDLTLRTHENALAELEAASANQPAAHERVH